MSEIFFIADTHFGHKNIIRYEAARGHFNTIDEHDAELITRWNRAVSPKDVVWHLGDAVFGKRNMWKLGELNGSIKLVAGNHDMYQAEDYLQYVQKIYGAVEYKGLLLTHVPVHSSQVGKGNRYMRNVHGHLHGGCVLRADGAADPNYINVSCEQTDLAPIPYDELLNRGWDENGNTV